MNGLEERLKDENKAESESPNGDEAFNSSRDLANNAAPAAKAKPQENWKLNNKDDLPKALPVAGRTMLYEMSIIYLARPGR